VRADRLISIILLLKKHEVISACKLARELDVSPRTIYRDIDALCKSGVPIYAEYGAKGGFALMDTYNTDLTGLHTDEILSLLLLDNSPILSSLGLGQPLSSALRKLTASLPDGQMKMVDWHRQRVIIDSDSNSDTSLSPGGILFALHDSVLHEKMVVIRIEWPRPDQGGTYLVSPVGIVASMDEWYLAAIVGTFIRVYPLRFIAGVEVTDRAFQRPNSFDLPAFWAKWKDGMNRSRPKFVVTVAVSPEIVRMIDSEVEEDVLKMVGRSPVRVPEREDGKLIMDVTFGSLISARSFALIHGNAVEVLNPIELRKSIADFASQTSMIYSVV